MEKDKEICTHNCSCKSGDDCHTSGVLNYMELHACQRSYHEDYPHENGEYVNQCYRCRHYFVGHKRRVCCKICLPTVIEKTEGKGFTIIPVGNRDEEINNG